MTGFDPTAFLGDDPEPAATAGDTFAAAVPAPAVPETSENRDVWQDGGQSVATAATAATAVAAPCELLADQPFAADLNKLFRHPESARYAGEAWRRLCLALHHFTVEHTKACLAAGWSAREIYAVGKGAFLSDDDPITDPRALLHIGSPAAAFVVGKREVIEIRSDWIMFVADRHGTRQRLMRDHNPINHSPLRFGLVWEVPLF